MTAPRLTRRDFAKASLGLTIAFALLPRLALAAPANALPGSLANNPMLDAWLRVDADGTVTVMTGKVELGQGILTALAQIAAEELALPLARVRMISGDTGSTPNEGFTAGSQSIEYGGTAVRLAAAEARAILLDQAAQRLGVAAGELSLADGVITAAGGRAADGRSLGYGELAAEGIFHREASATARTVPPAERKLVGKPIPRLDIPAKVTGGAIYVQDMRLPGMLHGRVVRPPRYGAALAALDDDAVRKLPGVVALVRDGSFLGVVAEREEQAVAAREALAKAARWEGGAALPEAGGIHAYLRALPSADTVVSVKDGTAPAAVKTLAASYTKPYLAHASIGPSCALAEFKEGTLRLWSHTQGVFPLRRDLAKALGLPESAIRVLHAQGSGCYGHNGADDAALDAALLARAVPGRPVRLQWMRDDEFAWEPFGAAMTMALSAGLSAEGRIVRWQHELWSNTHSTRPGEADGDNLLASWYLAQPDRPGRPHGIPQPAGGGDRNAVPLYDFPVQRVVSHLIPAMPIRVSALRTLGAYANVFALESFMDELAAAAGADPLAFRLLHLNDSRARAVVERAAAKAGWRAGVPGDGVRGRGMGFAKYKNLSTYVAVVAEVEIDRASGMVSVPRATAAVDAGQIINPDGLANQIEGGIIQSTSWTLKEEVRFASTGIASRDWLGYPILTFPEVPAVELALIDRPEEKPLGAGEASQGPMAAAIANAFAHASGVRIRELPLTPERVKAALG
ncbi:MAG TPA: molybdopterin cofactor-binding domain-containing protein [Alphaproteobacteria bacterium]|nr:molybdopterin cofactor-binding domain-containing protein [Alphaproteobacteria bacterium]